MMRHITLALTCLTAGTLISQAQVLVNVRSHDPKILELDAPESYTIDLGDYFQTFGNPGPVATFTLRLPVQTGFQQLLDEMKDNAPNYDPEGRTNEYMTYELTSGGSYSHLFDPAASAENYVFKEYDIDFQLFADVAPVTVGNFLQYAWNGDYKNSVIHRIEEVLIQAGLYRISEKDGLPINEFAKRGPIVYEETIDNIQGTLGMARPNSSSMDTATSQFYVNLVDNTEILGKFYSVFGQVVDPETSLPLLEEINDVEIWDLTAPPARFSSNLVFQTTPLYSPFYLQKDSWLRFKDITIPEGTRTGVTYSYEFLDADGEEGTSEEEAAHQAAFDITINGDQLEINRNNSGQAWLEVKGSVGDQEQSFIIPLWGYNINALISFDALASQPLAIIETDGILESVWYGRMNAEEYPQIFHEEHGEQWVHLIQDDDGFNIGYFNYDIGLDSWIYTTPNLYPLIYMYKSERWLWYIAETGNVETAAPRVFFDFDQQSWLYLSEDGSFVEVPESQP